MKVFPKLTEHLPFTLCFQNEKQPIFQWDSIPSPQGTHPDVHHFAMFLLTPTVRRTQKQVNIYFLFYTYLHPHSTLAISTQKPTILPYSTPLSQYPIGGSPSIPHRNPTGPHFLSPHCPSMPHEPPFLPQPWPLIHWPWTERPLRPVTAPPCSTGCQVPARSVAHGIKSLQGVDAKGGSPLCWVHEFPEA